MKFPSVVSILFCVFALVNLDLSTSTAQPTGIDLTPYQQIRFVSQSTGSDTLGDGSEALPWMTISHALDQITDATQTQVYAVLISSGTYTGRAEYSSFEMKEWVHLFGGFNPANWVRDIKLYPTVLSGEDVSLVLFMASHSCADGLVITRGAADVYTGGGVTFPWIQSATVTNCVIKGNRSSEGGGIAIHYSTVYIENCVISNNYSDVHYGKGGGIACFGFFPIQFVNCVISNNTGLEGGAVYTYESSPEFINCTLVDNRSLNNAGGVYANYISEPLFYNCILWNWGSEIIYGWHPEVTVSNCCIRGGWTGSDNIDAYPLFVDPGSGDYHLINGSPCIDSASPTMAPLYDHDHNPRPGGDGKVDIGAYESPENFEPIATAPLQKIYVSAAASPGGNGASWEQSLPSIQDALRFASAGAEIWVASGVYPEAIWCRENVSLYGGFTGNETTLLERTPEITKTIIDATGTGYCAVVMADGTTIDGFTIQGGCGVDAGGVSMSDISSATLSYSVIRWNQQLNGNFNLGAGMTCRNSNASIIYCTIEHNSGQYYGGVYINNSHVTFDGCIISSNESGAACGGIECDGGTISFVNCLVCNNKCKHYGGLYFHEGADVTLTNCTITGNTETGPFVFGSGIYCNWSYVHISNCILWNRGIEIGVKYPKNLEVEDSCIQGGWEGEGNINCYPCFVDPSNGDYHLLDGSCCIDAASIETAPFFDLDGNFRSGGDGLVDMGAYEMPDNFTANPNTPPSRFYVSTRGPVHGDGKSWNNAFTSIDDAMWHAVDGPEIWVASGEYHESIWLEDGVKVYGGFSGADNSLEERDWVNNPSVINAIDKGNRVITGAEGIILSGFTLTGGRNPFGGGLYLYMVDSCTIEHCVVSHNIAVDEVYDGYGGGIYSYNSSPLIYDCTINNNCALGSIARGGGYYFNGGTPLIINCTIKENWTDGSTSGINGGLAIHYSSPTLINCVISRNYSFSSGGIGITGSSCQFNNCTIVDNQTEDGYTIFCETSSDVVFSRCILWNPGGEIRAFDSIKIKNLYSFIQGGWGGENYEQYPMFVDPENGDYHLLNGSPCIDWGSENIPSETDRDGNPRVQGFAADAGAYESPASYDSHWKDPQHRFFVSASVPEGGKGISWSDPLRSIKDALWFSTGNAEIWVASGVYHEAITLEETTRLYGGFHGHETNVNERDWVSNPTVIDATGTGERAITGVNDVVIDGFEVRGGETEYGGGIRLAPVKSATVSNCRITLNTAHKSGGGVYANGSSYNLTNCFITRNRCIGSEVRGAGMVLLDKGSVYNCVVNDNQMIGGYGSNYVGVSCQNVSLINCTMTGNRMLAPHSSPISTLGHLEYSTTFLNCLLWNDLDKEISGPRGYLYPFNCNFRTLSPDWDNSNISADPHLAEDGYHLLEGSPCIGAGKGPQEDSRVPLFDIDGEPRSGATCDIGADEYRVSTKVRDWTNY